MKAPATSIVAIPLGSARNRHSTPEKAKQIAEAVKAAFQAADPTLAWFEDPATRALAGIEGFQGTQGWYGGYVKNKSMVARVEIVLSNVTGNATIVTVFAKPLTRRDLK